jgi:cytochrome c-type biogenesis protein CcmH/NrfG
MNKNEQQIRDEIALREASLADARRELDIGELSVTEAAAIEAKETVALTKARAELKALNTAGPLRSATRRRRRWLLLSALGCFFIAAAVLLWSSLSPRQAGTSDTGGLSLGHSQQVTQLLNEAEADLANGNVVAALSAYEQVLVISPKNVAALTETGWLDFSAGSSKSDATLVALGVKDLRMAIVDGPKNPAPRLYYAIVADSTKGNTALAKSEFEVFLKLHPSKGELAIARPFLKALGLTTK